MPVMRHEKRRRYSGGWILRRQCLLRCLVVGSFIAVVWLSGGAWWTVVVKHPLPTSKQLTNQLVSPLRRRQETETQQQQQQQQPQRDGPPRNPVDMIASTASVTRDGGNGAFVHVGKTGGSTISVLLRHGCHSFMPHPCRTTSKNVQESLASQLISTYYHVPDFGRLAVPSSPRKTPPHTFYVITSRDPVDRLVSAFVFDHIRNRFARNETVDLFKTKKYETAYECFPTLQRFVDLLGDDPHHFSYPHKQNWVSAESCPDLAKAAIHSRVKIYNHLYFSYQTLLQLIPSIDQQILYTIRQEHLWPDWISLNVELGQDKESIYIPPNQEGMIRNVTYLEATNRMPVTRDLTVSGQAMLCHALRAEYRAYLWLLMRSRNLTPETVRESIEAAHLKCASLDIYAMVRQVSP